MIVLRPKIGSTFRDFFETIRFLHSDKLFESECTWWISGIAKVHELGSEGSFLNHQMEPFWIHFWTTFWTTFWCRICVAFEVDYNAVLCSKGWDFFDHFWCQFWCRFWCHFGSLFGVAFGVVFGVVFGSLLQKKIHVFWLWLGETKYFFLFHAYFVYILYSVMLVFQ